MAQRAFIVMLVLCWYVAVRTGIYRFAISDLKSVDDSESRFVWWWSWFMAIPATFLSIVLPGILIAFVIYGGP